MTYLALLAACILPLPSEPVRDYADVVEVNRHYGEDGERRYVQIVFWDWSHSDRDYRVRTWRWHVRDFATTKHPCPLPVKVHGFWRCDWFDGGDVHRVVESMIRRDTWTQDGWAGDPEQVDKQIAPWHARREFTLPPEPSP